MSSSASPTGAKCSSVPSARTTPCRCAPPSPCWSRTRSATEFALVAAEPLPPGEALVGAVARAAVTPGRREAEFAILVSRFIANMGLGRHLMRRLVRWARGKELDRLYGDVLEHNQPMLQLAESMGFHREQGDAPGLVRVVLDLRPAQAA